MLSPVKLWVLAMLAPSGAARGSGPAAARRIGQGQRTTAVTMAGRDEGTGALSNQGTGINKHHGLAAEVIRQIQSNHPIDLLQKSASRELKPISH